MDLSMQTLELALRVAAAILLGAAIGLERQWRSRMAGIRTNALVSGGSALFVVLGAYGFEGVTADPTRVAAQVVSGIGFLGAGVILREGLNIRGLNTAATLWCAAAIGSLAGAGLLVLALVGAASVVGANTLMRPVSRLVNRRRRPAEDGPAEDDDGPVRPVEYVLEAKTTDKSEHRVRALVLQAVSRPELTLRSLRSSNAKNSRVVVHADLLARADADAALLERAVQRLSLDPKVMSVRWWAEDDADD
ncbi:MgtC/SapB family protein [Microbacterium resistens]|uniref:MgtC/SapB family protein n=1 Tax=Microbacterium resistens TaxID=156977 RepID=A0ABY3RQ46_9MICO|nr:MgtC/SapB family protein [Microbacterium resistens]UGS26162.1 MgtC/SapB family protein [Microbacterium resistens]